MINSDLLDIKKSLYIRLSRRFKACDQLYYEFFGTEYPMSQQVYHQPFWIETELLDLDDTRPADLAWTRPSDLAYTRPVDQTRPDQTT